MSRRRHAGMAFSFFLFQDLITGLSGLMIFLVILMLLDSDLTAEKAPPDPEQARVRAELDTAEADIKQLRAELDALDQKQRTLDESPFHVLYAFEKEADAATKATLLIECSVERFSLQRMQSPDAPLELKEANLSARSRRLIHELSKRPPAEYDVLLLLKPSAFYIGHELIGILKQKGYRVGTEPMEDNRSGLNR